VARRTRRFATAWWHAHGAEMSIDRQQLVDGEPFT
jgi:hypothetical protein